MADLRTTDVETLRAAGTELGTLLADVLEAGQTTTWSAAHTTMFDGKFRNARMKQITEAADALVPGASALIRRGDGFFSDSPNTEAHARWLQARGFAEDAVPGRQALKKKSKFTQDKQDVVKNLTPERFAGLYEQATPAKRTKLLSVATPEQAAELASGLTDDDILAGL